MGGKIRMIGNGSSGAQAMSASGPKQRLGDVCYSAAVMDKQALRERAKGTSDRGLT